MRKSIVCISQPAKSSEPIISSWIVCTRPSVPRTNSPAHVKELVAVSAGLGQLHFQVAARGLVRRAAGGVAQLLDPLTGGREAQARDRGQQIPHVVERFQIADRREALVEHLGEELIGAGGRRGRRGDPFGSGACGAGQAFSPAAFVLGQGVVGQRDSLRFQPDAAIEHGDESPLFAGDDVHAERSVQLAGALAQAVRRRTASARKRKRSAAKFVS